MRLMLILVLALLLTFAGPAFAQQAEVRAISLQKGCKPVKIDPTTPSTYESTFTVTCEKKGQNGEPLKIKVLCKNHLCVVRD